MRTYSVYVACIGIMFLGFSIPVQADNQWGNYRGVERPQPPSRPPQGNRPPPPSHGQRPPPPVGQYPNYPQRPQQGSYIEYHYQPSTQYQYHSERYVFVRGHTLPIEYRNEQYLINDWYGHQLYEPPWGTRWYRVGEHYLLISDDSFRIEVVR